MPCVEFDNRKTAHQDTGNRKLLSPSAITKNRTMLRNEAYNQGFSSLEEFVDAKKKERSQR